MNKIIDLLCSLLIGYFALIFISIGFGNLGLIQLQQPTPILPRSIQL